MIRMSHFFAMAVLACFMSASLHAKEMLIAFNGKTSYQLVTPPPLGHDYLDKSLQQATQVIVDAFAAQGVTLPVVSEADHDASKNTIYLGNTKFAKDNGVTFAEDASLTYTLKVVGKHLIIAGNDQIDPIKLENRNPREHRHGGKHTQGTLKAASEFVYRYAGTRFIQPGEAGVVHLPAPIIFVPDDLNLTTKPWGADPSLQNPTNLYATATGLPLSPRTFTYAGHYHITAFNDEDKKKNPEFFIFRAGKRQTQIDHYCFSNPQVRERIYQSVLKDIDNGFDIIEMGQNDGFTPCNCKECFNLYDIKPTFTPDQGRAYLMDPAWGEKLWIMHRDMAVRLQKDRPQAKLMISAYSVARNPPRTIPSFPENVIIQIMKPEAELMKEWSKLHVPGGYSAYVYLWGSFPLSGYTPRRSRFDMEKIFDVLLTYNMQLQQNNGKPVNYGIEGPNIYVYNRLMNDPKLKSVEELYNEYILAAYQESAGQMNSFFRKLHQRLAFMDPATDYSRELNRNPLLLYNTLYTPDLMTALEDHLKAAQKIAKNDDVKHRLATVAFEFEFLRQITSITNYYHTYLYDPTPETHKRVVDAVEARNQWLEALVERSKKEPGVPSFFTRKVQAYKVNGRWMNIEPFNWDVAARRELNLNETHAEIPEVVAAKAPKSVKIDSPQWDNVAKQSLSKVTRLVKDDLQQPTTFQVMYDDKNLYVRVTAGLKAEDMKYESRGRDAEIWLQESINVQVSPSGDKSQYFYLSYEPVDNSFTDAEHGFITDPLHPQFGWNDNTWDGDWSYVNKLDKANNQWVSLVTIPFATIRTPAPTSGSVWMFNVARVHFRNQGADPGNRSNREHSAWAGDINASKIPGDAYMSPLVFE